MSFFYPKIDETTIKNLKVVCQLVQAHPGYFLEAPYSKDTEETLIGWFVTRKQAIGGAGGDAPKEDRAPWDMLYQESLTLFKALTSKTFAEEGETAEQMAYFRTATSLLEKLVSLQERSRGLKEIGEFQRVVMDILESVLTPAQRTSVMEQLTEAIAPESNRKENAN